MERHELVSESVAGGHARTGSPRHGAGKLPVWSVVVTLALTCGSACESRVGSSSPEPLAVGQAQLSNRSPQEEEHASWFRSDFGVGRGINIDLAVDEHSSRLAYLRITSTPDAMTFQQELYVTDSGGLFWSRVRDVVDDGQSILGLLPDRNRKGTAYVGLGFPGALLRTRDHGATWKDITSGFTGLNYMQPMAVAAHNSRVLYAVAGDQMTRALNLFRSEDRGSTWRLTNVPVARGCCCRQVAATSDQHAYASSLCPGSSSSPALLETQDGGRNWTALPLDLTFVDTFVVDPREPGTLYAGNAHEGTDVGLRKSVDGGATWFAPSEQFAERQVGSIAIGRGRIYLATAGESAGIVVSRDGGAVFSPAADGLEQRVVTSVIAGAKDRCGAYAIVEGRRVFRTIDGGGSCRR
jgi:photosystem II stability/assembly factor-like uncharacterized protein